MLIKFSANNSGGDWWLEDNHWKDLEKAGWYVIWGGYYFCSSSYSKIPEGKAHCEDGEGCKGHRKFESWKEVVEKGRWLGCLAKEAQKDFETVTEGLQEFERITGQDISDEGCNCCGAPFSFSWEDGDGECNFCSGEDCLAYIFPGKNKPNSLREAMERY